LPVSEFKRLLNLQLWLNRLYCYGKEFPLQYILRYEA
jgi:hypothetical protein